MIQGIIALIIIHFIGQRLPLKLSM